MDLFGGFFWTPGWTSAFTLLVAPLIGFVGVSLSLRAQRQRFTQELLEKRHDSLRDAFAELLSYRSNWFATVAEFRNYEQERHDLGLLLGEVGDSREPFVRSVQESTAELQIRCTRVELLTRDRQLLVPIQVLGQAARRLERDPIVNDDAWDKAHSAFNDLSERAKQAMAVHGLDRPLVTDSDPWRVRRREYKRAFKAGEAAVYAPPLWKHVWDRGRN